MRRTWREVKAPRSRCSKLRICRGRFRIRQVGKVNMTTLPHVLKRIRLNLARSKEFPSGSTRHGYEVVAPLDAAGHIDPVLWQQHSKNCGVRRFWDGEEEHGHLVHKPGGAEHGRWVFDYDDTADEDE